MASSLIIQLTRYVSLSLSRDFRTYLRNKGTAPQKVITGHKQTDAYLWVLEVIKLNEPAHLDAAEAALEKLTICPKDAEKRYRDWMVANGADILQTAFGTFFMDDPQHYLKLAR